MKDDIIEDKDDIIENFNELFNDFKIILSNSNKHGFVKGSLKDVKKALKSKKNLKGAFFDIAVPTEEQARLSYIKGIIDQLSKNLNEADDIIWRVEIKKNVKSPRIQCIFTE